jgi:serine phosphatase RsbU (regulator of sigma subunit)
MSIPTGRPFTTLKKLEHLWEQISYIGITNQTPEYLTRKIKLANRLVATVIISVSLLFIFLNIFTGVERFIIVALAGNLTSLAAYLLLTANGYHSFGRLLLSCLFPTILTINIAISFNLADFYNPPGRNTLMVLVVFPLILFDFREITFLIGGVLYNMACFFFLPFLNSWIGPQKSTFMLFYNPIFANAIFFICFLILIVTFTYQQNITVRAENRIKSLLNQTNELNEELKQTNEELHITLEQLHEQKEIIEEKNTDIIQSIEYAQTIQRALLPGTDIFAQAIPQHFLYFNPRDIVSGDFYYIDDKKIHDRVYFAIADCTGHGVPGAFMSMLGINLLNEIVDNDPQISVDSILYALDLRLRKALRQTGQKEESKDGMDIAICCWMPLQQQLEIAAAGRTVFLILADQNKITEIKGNRFPIGGAQYTEKHFDLYTFQTPPKTRVYLFSDGITDQFGGTQGRKFTIGRLKKAILDTYHLDITLQGQHLAQQIDDWKLNNKQIDDMTLLCVELS